MMSSGNVWTVVAAFLTGVIGPLLIIFVKNRLKKLEKPDMVVDTLAVSEKIISKMEKIKETFGADRVWIDQFHNGGHFYPTGKSIAKFSMVYETVGAGIISIQNNFQNIPVSLFSKSINRLLESNLIEIYDYKDEDTNTYGLKYIAEEAGCKSTYLFAIKTIDNKFIGTLGLDYTKRKTKLEQDSIIALSAHATAIGGVLDLHLSKR